VFDDLSQARAAIRIELGSGFGWEKRWEALAPPGWSFEPQLHVQCGLTFAQALKLRQEADLDKCPEDCGCEEQGEWASVSDDERAELERRQRARARAGEVREGDKLRGYYPAQVRRGIFKGVDLAALAKRLWRLPSMRGQGPVPAIRYRTNDSKNDWVGGYAYASARVVLRLPAAARVETAAEALCHELVHCSCPVAEHHGELFRRRLIAVCREAFGLQLDVAALMALPPGGHGNRAYAVDAALRDAMVAAGVGERLRVDAELARQAPPQAPADLAARRAAAAATRALAREAHAREMLVRWEKRAATAKRRLASWRKRVRYYEGRAAARGGEPS